MIPTYTKKSDKAEIDVFTSFVDTLAEGSRALVVGAVLQFLMIGTLWLGSPHPVFVVSLFFVVISAIARVTLMRTYRTENAAFGSDLTVERHRWARNWELRYRVSVFAMCLNIGIVAYFGLLHVSGPYHVAASLTLVFAAVPSVIGRLFGSKPLALGAILCLLLPPSLGSILRGELLFVILGCLSFPYALLTYSMIKGVRAPVEKAVRSRHEIARIAAEFDVALNNMTHALLMFDDSKTVLVANDRALDIFGFKTGTELEGRSLGVLLRYASIKKTMKPNKIADLAELLERLLANGGGQKEFSKGNAEYLEFSVRVRDDGISVLVAEEVTERVLAKRELEKMARFDGLTGLMNRHYFAEEVLTAVGNMSEDKLCAFAVLDIDEFKHINDSIGHSQGDKLLQSLALRLKGISDSGILVARHGGDEFLAFVPDLNGRNEVANLVQRLNTTLSGLYRLNGEPVKVGISVGLYAVTAKDFDLGDAMVKADIALYRVKSTEKNGTCIFEQEMEDAYRRRQYIKGELIDAIEAGDLEVIYQPIIDVSTGRIAAAEALARWNHPVLGTVSPSEFIPLAEEVGLITQITEQVLEKACRDCMSWSDSLSVSVNLSAIDFHGRRVQRLVKKQLAQTGLDPARLELEITEGVAMRNGDEVLSILQNLRSLGVRIALDDFGTGYSGLSNMQHLPLDSVKVDRSFVQGIENDKVISDLLNGIMGICRILGRTVTVEGVESIEQLESVVKNGLCNRIQGFVFGAALPSSGIEALTHLQFTGARSELAGVKKAAG